MPAPPDTANIDRLQALAGNEQFRAVAGAAEQLRQDAKTWAAACELRSRREPEWLKLASLLDHAPSLGDAAAGIRTQRDAILERRLLLDSPDPVGPLIDQITKLLRTGLTGLLATLRSACETEVASLGASEQGKRLSDDKRQRVLSEVGLVLAVPPDISDSDKLLEALHKQSLEGLKDQIQAVAAKGAAARKRFAEILDPEPKVVSVSFPSATLKSEADVDNHLSAYRSRLMEHIAAGETVIV